MHDSPTWTQPAPKVRARVLNRTAKRALDLALGGGALLVLSPVLLAVALLVKREDGGPAFYLARRTGKDGKPFRMYKFRTMVVNADQIGGPSTAGDDPRITRIGRRIRRYKLDEIVQLVNVVKGDMSLVGPRPEVQHYTDMFTPREREILSVRPGITDWASIRYRNEAEILSGAADPEQAYMERIRPGKLRLQLEYVHRQSFLVDLQILAQTAAAVLRRPTPE
jgi:lipopolysaccharide/colanic/teichoic acid biosynthesis glycosyltransferase